MVVIMTIIMVIIMAMIDADNWVVVIMVMVMGTLVEHHGTVMMVSIVVVTVTLIHAHAYASRTDVKVLGDRCGRNCYCKTENKSERRQVFHFGASL